MLAINHILVPTDFSDHAEAALAHAVELARTHDATVHLLHVVETPAFPSFYGAGAVALYEEIPDLEAKAHDALGDLARTVEGSPPPIKIHVETGTPGASIVAFADEHAMDLIVIAAQGRTGLERLVLGSVAEKVVRGARCSVFVVKSTSSSLVSGRPPVAASDEQD